MTVTSIWLCFPIDFTITLLAWESCFVCFPFILRLGQPASIVKRNGLFPLLAASWSQGGAAITSWKKKCFVTKRITSGKYKSMDYLEVRVTSSTPKAWPPRRIVTAWETAQGRVPRLIDLIKRGGRIKKEITNLGKKRDGQQVHDDHDSQAVNKKAKAT